MSATAPRFVRSSLDAVRYYLAGIWKRANEVPIFIWAQAIAFKVLVTILPLILIATGIFGLVLRQENPFDTVAGYLRTFLPVGQTESLVNLLYQLQEASSTITIFGSIFLFLAVITLFSVLRYIVATAVGDRHTYRSIPGGYAFDFRMVLQVGLLFLLSFGLTFAVNTVSTESTEVYASSSSSPARTSATVPDPARQSRLITSSSRSVKLICMGAPQGSDRSAAKGADTPYLSRDAPCVTSGDASGVACVAR